MLAGVLACLASIDKHGQKLALAAWSLVLVGVEAAGTQVAVHSAMVVAGIFAVMAVCDALRYAVKHTSTWRYVAYATLFQHFYILVAWPAVLVVGPVQLLFGAWLDPAWLHPKAPDVADLALRRRRAPRQPSSSLPGDDVGDPGR